MPIYRFGQTAIERVEETTFGSVGVRERADLQRLLREHIEVISPNTLIISEEFGEWEESRRRILTYGVSKDAEHHSVSKPEDVAEDRFHSWAKPPAALCTYLSERLFR